MPSITEFRNFYLQKNPNATKEDLKKLDEFIQKQMALEMVDAGVSVKDIPAAPDLREALYTQVKSGEFAEEPSSNELTLENLERKIGLAEQLWFPHEDKLALSSQPGNILERKAGKLQTQWESSSEYEAFRRHVKTLGATLAKAAGDTGNIAWAEQAAQLQAMADADLTKEEALNQFKNIRVNLGLDEKDDSYYNSLRQGKGSKEAKDYTKLVGKEVEPKNSMQRDLGSAAFLVPEKPEATPKAQPQGQYQAPDVGGLQQGDNPLMWMLARLQERLGSKQTPLPAGLDNLAGPLGNKLDLSSLGFLLGGSGGGSVGAGVGAGGGKYLENLLNPGSTIQDKGLAALVPSQEEAVDIGTTGAKAALFNKLIGVAAEKLPGIIAPRTTGQSLRNKAISGASKEGQKIKGTKLYNSLVEWGKEMKQTNLKSSQIKAIDDIVNNAKRFKGKALTPEYVKNIWDQSRKGYTAAGKAGQSLIAEYNRALRDAARKELDLATQGSFEKGTELIASGMKRAKVLGKAGSVGGSAGVGAVVGGGIALLLNKLLGNQER